mmetsp:Transcript_103444/g.163228  ORF Transcript_103444/g.163228 Transcript_103444/m.163228 type:complete len:457 (-) Transcript_103444:24-1394(-)
MITPYSRPVTPPRSRRTQRLGVESSGFSQQDFELGNSTIAGSRLRSLSNSSRHTGAAISSPQPLSAERLRIDVGECVAVTSASDCAEVKNESLELCILPSVQTSKPPTSEVTEIKMVRRRSFQQNTSEKLLQRADSCSTLVRRATFADGETSLNDPRTISDPCASPARVKRSTSVGRPPLRRVKTVDDSLSLNRANDNKRLSRRSCPKTKDEMDVLKMEALEALVLSSCTSGKPMAEILDNLTRHVLKQHGTNAFTASHIAYAEAKVAEESKEEGADFQRVGAVLKALRYMAELSGIQFSDVVGQILWRNRRADSLREKPRRKEAVDDVSWVVDCAEDPNVAGEVLKALDDVFDVLEGGTKGKGISAKAWHRAAKFVEANPVLKRRVRLTDVDRLWHAATHKPLSDPQTSISRRAFKELLLTWCDAMEVHPWMVFVAVGSHACDAPHFETSQKITQ